MSPDRTAEQRPLDIQLVRAFVECLPSTWRAARLEVTRREQGGSVQHAVSIQGPGEHPAPVPPSDALLLAIRELDLFFTRHGDPFTRLRYEVQADAEGNWDFTARYEYV